MKVLLYCIFRSPTEALRRPLLGVGGEPVSVTAHNGLSAAVSRYRHSRPRSEVPHLLAYGEVIDSFHRRHTVIPVRYGSVFEDECAVQELLHERGRLYTALLEELDGCVEMGIRVLLEAAAAVAPDGRSSCSPAQSLEVAAAAEADESLDGAPGPGRAFLAALRNRYAEMEEPVLEQKMLVARIRSSLSGLFVEWRNESRTVGRQQLLSLQFLVRRAAVGRFRNAFRRLGREEPAKLLLSGPWPPYNFVVAAN